MTVPAPDDEQARRTEALFAACAAAQAMIDAACAALRERRENR